MKNVACIVLACVLVLIFSTSAFCETQNYFSFSAGILRGKDSDEDDDPGYIGALSVGLKKLHWRVDGEYAYCTVLGDDDNDPDVMLHTLTGNVYCDFLIDKKWTPYLSLGLGLGVVDITGDYEGYPKMLWQSQVGLGLSFEIQENLLLDFRYRYLVTSELPIEAHTGLMGIRYYF